MITGKTFAAALCCVATQLLLAPVTAHSASWAEYEQLHISTANAAHGSVMAMTSEWLVVGEPEQGVIVGTTSVAKAGAISIYRWVDGWQWWEYLSLSSIGQTPVANAHFGASVAVSGDHVLVGCPGCAAGKHVFMIDETDPVHRIFTPLTIASSALEVSDPDLGTGAAVALDGDLIAVGSPRTAPFLGGKKYGAVWFGHFDGTGFISDATFVGHQDGAHYGLSLALTDVNYGGTIPTRATYLAVGAPAYVNTGGFGLAGRVVLLKAEHGVWDAPLVFDNPNPGLADGMGMALAYYHPQGHGNAYLAVGLPGRVINGQSSGSVRIYNAGAYDDNYDLQTELSLPDPVSGDHFGGSLALAPGTVLLAGAPGRAVDLSPNAGSAYLFHQSGNAWSLDQTLFPRSGDNQVFGTSVAMASRRGGAIGAPAYGAHGEGNVYAYLCDSIFFDPFEGEGFGSCSAP